MQILVLIVQWGLLAKQSKYYHLVTFFDCPVPSCPARPVLTFLRDPTPRSNRWTDFHALWLKRRVSAQGWSFLGLERWVTMFGENMPPKLPQNGRE